jgi:diaminopimelate epimerase
MLRFEKYHGLGNDFVVVDRLKGGELLTKQQVIALCDRHRGIGADGVLSIWSDPKSDARMQVQNADGSDSDMCGNGLRCVARYLYDAKILPETQTHFKLSVGDNVYPGQKTSADTFTIEMGQAVWQHPDLPAQSHGEAIELTVEDGIFLATCVFLGNPHAVIVLRDQDDPLKFAQQYGSLLEHHPAFKKRTNVSFVVPNNNGYRVVVHERGAGITQACGSGACAVGLSLVQRHLWPRNQPVEIALLGGVLTITVLDDDFVLMQGDAQKVFSGEMFGF